MDSRRYLSVGEAAHELRVSKCERLSDDRVGQPAGCPPTAGRMGPDPVPPPAEDAVTVSTWLDLRRQANANEVSAASALKRGNVRKYFRLLGPADAESDASERAISGFGFQVCGPVTRSR